ncbi:retrovirus-related Pol polyprotein from transposon opus [Trichonephila clavipes]|nr:retrovirus-related Pol polyprotein from transposon opus [Trichonephila clavipes]
MSPETFRQKFMKHQRIPARSWRDFVFEITSYFEEWLDGMEAVIDTGAQISVVRADVVEGQSVDSGGTIQIMSAFGEREVTELKIFNLKIDDSRHGWKKYLEDLIEKLRKAHEIAAETAEATQNNYASYYNLRSREKQFKVGDKVLVLLPSSTHKLMKTWIGPATIIEITRPYSAKVELDDGGIRELHFNKLRPYIARVGQVGFDLRSRLRFRDLHYAPTDMAVSSMGDVTDHISSDCQELDDVQRLELLNTLGKFSSLFSSLPGLAKSKRDII